MPGASAHIEQGIRYERGGVLDGALASYQQAVNEATTPELRSEALRRQADVLRLRCEWDAAAVCAEAAAAVAREAGHVDLHAEALNAHAAIEQSRGRIDRAVPLYRLALEEATDPRIRACALQNLGAMSAMSGDHITAVRFFEESLISFRESGYERGIAIALNNVGRSSIDSGDYGRAQDVLERAIAHARLAGDLELASVALVNLAEALIPSGDLPRAEEEASAALGFFKVSGNLWRQVECFKILGDLRRARGEPDIARRLYDQGLLIAARIDATHEAGLIEARLADLDRPRLEQSA